MQPTSKRSTPVKKQSPDASALRAEVQAHRAEAQAMGDGVSSPRAEVANATMRSEAVTDPGHAAVPAMDPGLRPTVKLEPVDARRSDSVGFDARPTPPVAATSPVEKPPAPALTAEQAGARLLELLAEFKVAMLVTREGKSLSARPMSLAEIDAKTATAWFISSVDAARTRALEFAPRVQIVCQSSAVHLSVSGNATLVRDAVKLEALWSEPMRVWFPDGKESADLTLIRVELGDGEFWDQSGSRGLKFIFDAAKAWLTGEVVEGDATAHARANLHQS